MSLFKLAMNFHGGKLKVAMNGFGKVSRVVRRMGSQPCIASWKVTDSVALQRTLFQGDIRLWSAKHLSF